MQTFITNTVIAAYARYTLSESVARFLTFLMNNLTNDPDYPSVIVFANDLVFAEIFETKKILCITNSKHV